MNQFLIYQFFLVVSISLLISNITYGSTPVIWNQSGHRDFLKGETRGISITGKGNLVLSPDISLILEIDEALIWCLAYDSKGNLYAGTGNDGKLYRIKPNGESEIFFEADELEIRSIVVDNKDQLFVATFPNGRIYQIKADGSHSLFFDPGDGNIDNSKSNYIWSLALDPNGNLYVGTGDEGRIYRISQNGTSSLLAELEEAHVMALAWEKTGALIAGTAPEGRIYRISVTGDLSVLYDSPHTEVNTLWVDEKGFVFAGALSKTNHGPDKPSLYSSFEASVSQTRASRGDTKTTTNMIDRSPRRLGASGSVVYRIKPTGQVEEWWKSKTDVCLSLAMGDDGQLLVGTGPQGRVFSVLERGNNTLLIDLDESQVTTLMPISSGNIVTATSNRGNLYILRSHPVRKAEYISEVLDTQGSAMWGTIRWKGVTPPKTAVLLYTRSGNTDSPGQTWSNWVGPYTVAQGELIHSPPARYLQWKAVLTTQNVETPSISSVSVSYLTRNNPPIIDSVIIYEPGVYLHTPSPDLMEQKDLPSQISVQITGRGNPIAKKIPTGLRTYKKGMRTMQIQAGDPDGDKLSFDIFFRGEEEKVWKILAEKRHNSSYSWDTETFPDGYYVLRVMASDFPTNPPSRALVAEHFSNLFLVDNTSPRVSQINKTANILSFQVQDAASPLFRVEYSLNGELWKVIYPQDGVTDSKKENFEIDLGVLEVGEYTLAIRARDTSNNTGMGKRVITIP